MTIAQMKQAKTGKAATRLTVGGIRAKADGRAEDEVFAERMRRLRDGVEDLKQQVRTLSDRVHSVR